MATVLIALPLLFPLDGETTSDSFEAIGRFHILLLHIPIGLFLIVPLIEVLGIFRGWHGLRDSVPFIISLGIVSSWITSLLGFLLATGEGITGSLINSHMWAGIWTTVVMMAALLLHRLRAQGKSRSVGAAYMISLFGGVLLLVFGSHQGASLVHGKDFLFEKLPYGIRVASGADYGKDSPINFESVVFDEIIEPVLASNCYTCHGEGKVKGQFRMDSFELLQAGGKSRKPALVAGEPDKSEVFRRITLDRDDHEAMPPKDKEPLDQETIGLIQWWIQGGASDSMTVVEMMNENLPQRIEDSIIARMDTVSTDADAIDPDVLHQVSKRMKQQYGIDVFSYSQDTVDGFYVVTRNATSKISVQAIRDLLPIAHQIKSISFWGQALQEGALAELPAFINLRELHLNETNVTHSDLPAVTRLLRLRMLNLHGTGIGDESIDTLASMVMLRKLLLAGSAFSPDGVLKLQKALRNCTILASIPGPAIESPAIIAESTSYKAVANWGIQDGHGHDHGIGSTHGGIVIDDKGEIYISSDEGIFVYNDAGILIRSLTGDTHKQIHSLSIVRQDGVQYIYGSRNNHAEVIKMRTNGDVVMRIPYPAESNVDGKFKPTAVAVTPAGKILVADGYGSNYIFQFDSTGNYESRFGGKDAADPAKFVTPHGLAIDQRYDPARLLISDREKRRLVHFDLEGNFIGEVITGLRRPCAVSILKDYVAVAELEGRVIILDKENSVILSLGENHEESQKANYKVNPSQWREGVHTAPHGLSWDANGNLYVQDWNSSGRITKWARQ